VHNIPEGLAISLVLVPRGTSVRSAAGWSIFSSLPQPLMAVPAFLFVEAFSGVLPVGLGFAAGAMVWLVGADLLPEALETTGAGTVAVAVAGSALAMLVFLILLL
jgi:ZIP family zinc transporter